MLIRRGGVKGEVGLVVDEGGGVVLSRVGGGLRPAEGSEQ